MQHTHTFSLSLSGLLGALTARGGGEYLGSVLYILFLGNLGIPQLLVPRALRSTVPSSDSVALAMAGPVKMIRGMIWTSQVNHMKTFEARSLLHSLFFV